MKGYIFILDLGSWRSVLLWTSQGQWTGRLLCAFCWLGSFATYASSRESSPQERWESYLLAFSECYEKAFKLYNLFYSSVTTPSSNIKARVQLVMMQTFCFWLFAFFSIPWIAWENFFHWCEEETFLEQKRENMWTPVRKSERKKFRAQGTCTKPCRKRNFKFHAIH